MGRAMRRLCLVLCLMSVLLCLSACQREEPVVQVLDDLTLQPKYLSFFSSQNMLGSDVSKYWIDQFTQKYDKQVYINFDSATYYASEGLSYRELLEKRLSSSAPDDLYIINAEDVLAFEEQGYWLDLSGMDFVGNLSEAALYQSIHNGKVFSVPLSFTGFGLAWNVDLLAEQGLSLPQNQQEFWDVCEALKNAGILPYGANKGFALTVPAMCAGLSQLYTSPDLDERLAALNSGKASISDYLRSGFEFLSTMMERGYLDPEQALTTTPNIEDLELFLSGKCAFVCLELSAFHDALSGPFTMALTGVPALADGCTAVYGANNRLCINPNSAHLDTALEFIEMVGSPEALAQSAMLNHAMSSAKNSDVRALPEAQALISLLQQTGQIPNQDFALHFSTWESIRDVARELCKGLTIDQACAMLDARQQADLETYEKE